MPLGHDHALIVRGRSRGRVGAPSPAIEEPHDEAAYHSPRRLPSLSREAERSPTVRLRSGGPTVPPRAQRHEVPRVALHASAPATVSPLLRNG
jgi:hypothetical protein